VVTLHEDLVELRRAVHRHPEIGLDLPHTQRLILSALHGLPLEVHTGQGLSSVTAVLRGGRPGPTGPAVLLRGDMDALPVTELTEVPYASQVPGAMHACGHDLHVAGLVGAARLLAERRAELAGDVVFMFQPGEEGLAGAAQMISEGVLSASGEPVAAAYALHVAATDFPRGVFATRPGPLMSASASLSVRVVGAGGHGSAPHDAHDPIPAACEMVTALQTMVSRRFSAFEPVVVTVGRFHAGTANNVIPDEAVFEATVRTFSDAAAELAARESVRLCEHIAAAHGLRADVRFEQGYPATVNDPAEAAFAAQTVAEVFGPARLHPMEHPDPGSEDFAFVLQQVPGAFLFLGATPGDDHTVMPNNHSPRALFDDGVVLDAARLLAELALRRTARAA
jgi:amidohydrolase